jgi:pimeloyl-ACP methyl ester carboxylesterase
MSHLQLSNGRRLHYEVSRPIEPGATALVFHHGTPGGGLIWDGLAAAAVRQGWPVVMSSRPGYATSDRDQGRSVADVAADVAELVDHLGIGRFVTAGWSGGGPHALACGTLLGPRCAAVATIAGVAPFGAEGLDWTEGMGPENVEEFELLIAGEPGLEAKMAQDLALLAEVRADQIADELGGLISAPDRACLDDGFDDFMAAWFRLAVSTGADGYWDDNVALLADWGFDLGAIEVPVSAWRADLDLMVPPSHGEWLAAHVPGSSGIAKEGEGHISLLLNYIDDIIAQLAGDAAAL